MVVERESHEIVPELQFPETLVAPRIEYANNKKSNNELFREMAWEFVHSIVIQFSAEELSQYPFWAAKVALATTDINYWHLDQSLVSAFWALLSHKFHEGGLWALYRGCVPYALAAYLYNIAHVELLFKKFFVIVVSRIPRSPSAVAKYNQQQALLTAKNNMLLPHRGEYYHLSTLTADSAGQGQLSEKSHQQQQLPQQTQRTVVNQGTT